MAFIELNRSKLQHNYRYLDDLFRREGIDWAVVTKLLCGHPDYLKEVLDLVRNQVMLST